VAGNATPTHPIVTIKFLADNNLIGASRRQTIGNVLDWARSHLLHFAGPGTIENQYQYWQYWGAPPVARVLSGTISTDPMISGYGLRNWTEGCYGTTDWLVWVLRVLNIPVRRTSSCGHTLPYFSGEKVYLSHGDDPYDQLSKGGEPAELLLIDPGTWHSWIEEANLDGSCSQVGRRPVELSLLYIPDYTIGRYCADTLAGLDHAHGQVYEIYSKYYTVSQLEAKNLWTRLAAGVSTSTAYQCAPLQGASAAPVQRVLGDR
jgi:hypothetical protein